MVAIDKNSIKSHIKQVINSNPCMSMVVITGVLDSKSEFSTKKDFGNFILYQLKREDVNNIEFKGIIDNALTFRVINASSSDNFSNNRGYGQSKYMGD